MAVSLITAPIAKPVTLDQAKAHLRVEHSEDNTYIEGLVDASIDHLQRVLGLKLITQTWRQYLDYLPESGCLRLAVSPVQSIEAVNIYDVDGVAQPVAPDQLQLDKVSSPAQLLLPDNLPPGTAFNGMEIDIVAGYGDAGTDIPDSLRRALLLLIGHAYEFRGAVPVEEQPASEPHGFQTLIAPFRRVGL